MSKELNQRIQQCAWKIQQPAFPSYTVSILEFDANPNSDAVQTTCIQNAIDDVHKKGGGTVIIPSGRFLTGAIRLRSNVCLNLESKDSILLFTTETTQSHYPLVFSHWEATPCYNYSALIYALDEENIAVTGCGILDGQASNSNWWAWHHQVENAWSKDKIDLQLSARTALRRMNEDGIPAEDRRFGDGYYLRPNFLQLIRCKTVLLEGVTLKNSPMWQLNPVMCENVTIRGMTLFSHGPNSDGCDPESCTNVLIESNCFQTGDDCVSLKSGRDRDGRLAATPCQNIIIRNNLFLDGHGGIALGSEMSGGIQNVFADNNRFESPHLTYVLRFKTNAKRGGFIKNIWLYNTVATAVNGAPIHATMLYEDGPKGDYLPVFENIHIENLHAVGGDYGIFLEAFSQTPIRGLVLKNIFIQDVTTPLRASNWQAPIIENLTINQQLYPRPTQVRILGIPAPGLTVEAHAELLGGDASRLRFIWMLDGVEYTQGNHFVLPEDSINSSLQLIALMGDNCRCVSKHYTVLPHSESSIAASRLKARGILPIQAKYVPHVPITRLELAKLLVPFCAGKAKAVSFSDLDPSTQEYEIAQMVVGHNLMTESDGQFLPDATISRQEMATVAMQSCGVSYKNASSTMPDCKDVTEVSHNYGTNVARSLYWNFMSCDSQGYFHPHRPITWEETIELLNSTADFAAF